MKKSKKCMICIAVAVAVVICTVAMCLLTGTGNSRIDSSLAVFLDSTIMSHNSRSGISEDSFVIIDYEVLGTRKFGSQTTVYMWVLYSEYSYDDVLQVESSSHVPTAVTVKSYSADDDGLGYELVEYWTPRDGSYYVADINGKFPMLLRKKALDSQWCIDEQEANCLKNAQEYFGISYSVAGVYNISKMLYVDGVFSYYMPTEEAPLIEIGDKMNVNELYEDEKKDAGIFCKTKLSEENFDSLFTGAPMWTDYADIADFKGKAVKTWMADKEWSENGIAPYMLLQQKDGTMCLAYANVGDGAAECIRWIYLLEKVGPVTEDGTDAPFTTVKSVASEESTETD